MRSVNEGMVGRLVQSVLGDTAALEALDVDAALLAQSGGSVSRAAFAMALAVVLSDDLVVRVPSGAAYARREAGSGRRILFDHGALRTILFAQGPTGALPAGHLAFARILEPLGYVKANTYPLPRLKMTGHAYAHLDLPEAIPQYFVSELHVDRFDGEFADAAGRVFGTSRDPLGQAAQALLAAMNEAGEAPLELALAGLPEIVAAFARQHGPVALADYEVLLAQSAEAGWIATEGNSFNHVTDRVAHVEALADSLRAEGFPIKDRVEVAREGRVRQTALKADMVERRFTTDSGEISRRVPGSFYEFISREIDPATGRMDLSFDSSNATGIFAMTRAA